MEVTPARLAKELGSAVPDALWEHLQEYGYVSDAESGGTADWRELVAAARYQLRLAKRITNELTGSGEIKQLAPDALPRAKERDEAWAISEYVAGQAAREPRVIEFRHRVSGGTVLAPQAAEALLASPATRYFSFDWFARHHTAVTGHAAKMLTSSREHDSDSCNDDLEAGGVVAELEDPGLYVVRDARIFIDPPGMTFDAPTHLYPRRKLPEQLMVQSGAGAVGIEVLSGSVLDELRELSVWLTDGYGWLSPQAVWFVLTGMVPWLSPITYVIDKGPGGVAAEYYLKMRVALWTPYKRVLEIFRSAQVHTLGGENRRPSQRNLAVFRFVNERTDPDGRRATWRELKDEWNASQPDGRWQYGSDGAANFARDYASARRTLFREAHTGTRSRK